MGVPSMHLLAAKAAAGGTFSPNDIAGLIAWHDASDAATITSSGGLVSQWNDKSTSANNLTQATGSRKPTTAATTINGRNVLDFLGVSSPGFWMTATFSLSSTSLTAFCVAKYANAGASYGRLISIKGSGANDHDSATGAAALCRDATTQAIGTYRVAQKSTKAITYGTAFTATAWFDGTNNIDYIDGLAGTTVSSTGTFAPTALWVGNSPAADSWANASIGEILIYNSALSTTDRESVESYLSTKWGTP